MAERIDPGHGEKKQTLTLFAIVLLVVGGILLVVGLVNFATPFMTSNEEFFANPHEVMDRNGKSGFIGIALLGLGAFMMMAGGAMLSFAKQGSIARYAAGEIAPVEKDTFNYLAKESREGIRDVASAISEGVRGTQPGAPSPGKETIKVRCRSCGYLETEDAKFCSSCGQTL